MLGISLGSFQGVGMIVLQTLRIFTVITLLADTAALWVMMVMVDKKHDYFVFEAASLFFLSLVCIFLIVSEFPTVKFVKNFYRASWPGFSDRSGFTWLGLAMLLIGCNLLGHLNQPAYEEKKFGQSFWQLVMASGVLSLTFGAINILGSLVWRDGKNGINARDVRSKGSLADGQSHRGSPLPDYYSTASSFKTEKPKSKFMSMFWNKGDDKPQTSARPNISGPINAHPVDVERGEIEDRGSPIVPGVRRPDTALHPMNDRRSSRYSEAHMSRF